MSRNQRTDKPGSNSCRSYLLYKGWGTVLAAVQQGLGRCWSTLEDDT